jgi:hypothetical protein
MGVINAIGVTNPIYFYDNNYVTNGNMQTDYTTSGIYYLDYSKVENIELL